MVPEVSEAVRSSLPVVLPVVSCAFVDAEKAMVERTSNVVKIRADFFLRGLGIIIHESINGIRITL